MNNKGFTMVELLGVVLILGILMTTAVVGVSKYKENAERDAVEVLANTAMNSSKNYLLDYPSDNTTVIVSISDLYDKQYMERPTDPKVKDKVCTGQVKIIRTNPAASAASIKKYRYEVKVCCTGYSKLYKFPEKTVADTTCP